MEMESEMTTSRNRALEEASQICKSYADKYSSEDALTLANEILELRSQEPEGVVVPREPTAKMAQAGYEAQAKYKTTPVPNLVWEAMLAAAPSAHTATGRGCRNPDVLCEAGHLDGIGCGPDSCDYETGARVRPTAPTVGKEAVAWMTEDGRTVNAASRSAMHQGIQESFSIPLYAHPSDLWRVVEEAPAKAKLIRYYEHRFQEKEMQQLMLGIADWLDQLESLRVKA
jgi:hypothetical protein